MPETTIQDKWVDMVPKGFKLPPELTNPDATPEKPAEPQPEAKPQVAEAATPEPEKVETDQEPETTGKDPEKQTTRRFERRIDRLHKRAAEAQARAEFLEKQIAEFKSQSQSKLPAQAPRMEDFSDVQEYAKAFASYEKEQALKEFQTKQREDQQKTQITRLKDEWETQVSKASTKYEDWDEVVGEIQPNTHWAVALMRSENGADVAYYLGKHQSEARKILSMEDPVSQILEIGRISLKLQQPVEKPKAPSAAPKPITPVTPESKPSGDEIRPNQPYEEYRKLGNKMFGRGRRL